MKRRDTIKKLDKKIKILRQLQLNKSPANYDAIRQVDRDIAFRIYRRTQNGENELNKHNTY